MLDVHNSIKMSATVGKLFQHLKTITPNEPVYNVETELMLAAKRVTLAYGSETNSQASSASVASDY